MKEFIDNLIIDNQSFSIFVANICTISNWSYLDWNTFIRDMANYKFYKNNTISSPDGIILHPESFNDMRVKCSNYEYATTNDLLRKGIKGYFNLDHGNKIPTYVQAAMKTNEMGAIKFLSNAQVDWKQLCLDLYNAYQNGESIVPFLDKIKEG